MSTAQKTETKTDARVRVAGHPLPWTIEWTSFGREVMDSNRLVMVNLDDHGVDVAFWEGLVNDVNRLGAPRIAILEAALVEVVNVLQSAIPNSRGLGIATSMTIDIAKSVGLAHRVWGNPAEAEEAVS